jgi:hypothetical protein
MCSLARDSSNGPIVIVTGSRGWRDTALIADVLERAHPRLVVQGGAKGADEIGRVGHERPTFRFVRFAPIGRPKGGARGCSEISRCSPRTRVPSLLIDESRMKLTPSDRERHARAEIDTIAGFLPVDELTHLVAVGRILIDETKTETPQDRRRV